MSQVIVTEDKLKDKRRRSAEQEHRISREEQWNRWKRSDVTKKDPAAFLLGNVLPLIWLPFFAVMTVVLLFVEQIFKLLGKVFGGTRSLITGR